MSAIETFTKAVQLLTKLQGLIPKRKKESLEDFHRKLGSSTIIEGTFYPSPEASQSEIDSFSKTFKESPFPAFVEEPVEIQSSDSSLSNEQNTANSIVQEFGHQVIEEAANLPCDDQVDDVMTHDEEHDSMCDCPDDEPVAPVITAQIPSPAIEPDSSPELPAVDDPKAMADALNDCAKIAYDMSQRAGILGKEKSEIEEYLSKNEKYVWYHAIRADFHLAKFDKFSSIFKKFSVLPDEAFKVQKELFSKTVENVSSADFNSKIQKFSNELSLDTRKGPDVKFTNKNELKGKIADYGKEVKDMVNGVDREKPGAASQIVTAEGEIKKKVVIDSVPEFKSKARDLGSKFASLTFISGSSSLRDTLQSFKKFADDSVRERDSFTSEFNSKVARRDEIQKELNAMPALLTKLLTAGGCTSPEEAPPYPEGQDVEYRGNPNIKSPNALQMSYWRKYCLLASAINLVPVHWPIGLLVPNPSGILKVPMPIVWIPIAVIPLPVGFAVVLIGQCGACPSPAVFVYNSHPKVPLGPVQADSCGFPIAIRPYTLVKKSPGSAIMPGTAMVPVKGFAKVDPNPEATKKVPYIKDDFPTWERLSLSNPLLVLFLWKFCAGGKKSCGFFENP